MNEPRGPLRVVRVHSQFKTKDGTVHDHESVLLRQAWKQQGKVHRHTVASLTGHPKEEVDALEQVLNKGFRPVPTGTKPDTTIDTVQLGPGLTHGALAAVLAAANQTGLTDALGPPCRQRDLVMGLIAARLCHPASKISQLAWWQHTTLAEDLGLAGVSKDEMYTAMDWLGDRQTEVEKALATRHLENTESNPARLVLYDLTSTWVEGTKCEWAAYGYNRDKKKGVKQINFALIAAPSGIPVGVRVFTGKTSDPIACKDAIEAVRDQYDMDQAILVGDRGMITGTRINQIRELNTDPTQDTQIGWIGALRHDAIAALAADSGPLQMSLFDKTDLFSFTHPNYPGELLVACLNPIRAEHQATKRDRLIQATLGDLSKIAARVAKRNLVNVGPIERAVGKIINKHKVGRLVTVEVSKGHLEYGENTPAITAEATLDGVYVIRTSLTGGQMPPAAIVGAYKQLKQVERDFAWIKSTDIAVRPVRHWRTDRVQTHLLICMLAAIIEHHLREAWQPLTFTDEHPPPPPSPSTPAHRSPHADTKAANRATPNGMTLRSFGELLDHLGCVTRNTITINTPIGPQEFTEITKPTTEQAEAFRLLGVQIPKTLRY